MYRKSGRYLRNKSSNFFSNGMLISKNWILLNLFDCAILFENLQSKIYNLPTTSKSVMLNAILAHAHRVKLKGFTIKTLIIPGTIVILAALLLSSCVGAVQMFPTDTPTPDLTIVPTSTSTPTNTPTATSTPTIEPTPEPTILTGPIATARIPLRLGREEFILEGGFSYKGPIGYEAIYQPNQVTLTSEDEDTVFSLLGGKIEREEELQADFEQFIELISLSLVEFKTDKSYQYLVGGLPGLAAEVTGIYGENSITGRILIVAPAEDQIFYALAISPDISTGEGWEPEGRQAFEAVIRTVSFFEPTVSEE